MIQFSESVEKHGLSQPSAQRSFGRGVWLALMVFALLGLSGCSKRKDETVRADASPAQPLVVKTALVEERPVARYVEVVGSLKADQEVVVSSEVKGIIEELPVDLGSVVRRGQLLARLAQRAICGPLEIRRHPGL